MARKIDITVNNCYECPYCHFESEIGETFCVHSPTGEDAIIGLALQEHGLDIYKAIHIDCPLPFVKVTEKTEKVEARDAILDRVAGMYRDGGITGGDAKQLFEDIASLEDEPTLKCTALQVQEVNDCPEEWMEQIIEEQKEHVDCITRKVVEDVERLFEGFDETGE